MYHIHIRLITFSCFTCVLMTITVFLGTGSVYAQCNPQQTTKLTASDAEPNDWYGHAVSIKNNFAIVGSFADDDAGSASGSAYIYELIKDVWIEVAKLTASDAATRDAFGWAVDISNNVAIVGAYDDDHSFETMVGSAYIFTRENGIWSQTQKLIANDAAHWDWFGQSVSIYGDTAIVGAIYDDDNGLQSGSAYIFEKINGSWQQTAKLIASDGHTGATFGVSASIFNNTAVVGARLDNEGGEYTGAAYVYEKVDNSWVQTAKLKADDAQPLDRLGLSVEISGDTIIAGAWGDDDNGADSGSAYIFQKIDGKWTQTAKLLASDGEAEDIFGHTVSLSGDVAIVGAPLFEDNTGAGASFENTGAAYIFERINGKWSEIARITADDAENEDIFGVGVGITGNNAIVGSQWDDDDGDASGSAYIFDLGCSSGGINAQIINFNISTGTVIEGGLQDIKYSDDSYLHTRSDFGETVVDLHNMEISLLASINLEGESSIDLRIESHIDEPAGIAQIRMKNFESREFDLVGSFSIGNEDKVAEIIGLDTSIYHNTTNGRLRVKIKHLVFVPFLAFTFESFIDQVEIILY